jgi:DNA repair photolyase
MSKSSGNMYDWVTHTANPLTGECKHKCPYCYVNKLKHAKPVIANKYSGNPEISEAGLKQITGGDELPTSQTQTTFKK